MEYIDKPRQLEKLKAKFDELSNNLGQSVAKSNGVYDYLLMDMVLRRVKIAILKKELGIEEPATWIDPSK